MNYKNNSIDQTIRSEGGDGSGALEVERIEGNLVYIKGMKYPHKGLATPEAITAANVIKKLILGLIRFPLLALYPFKSIVAFFNEVGYSVMSPYILQDDSMCESTKTLRDLIKVFLIQLGIESTQALKAAELVSHVFEYDNAYRFRLQDLVSETSTKDFVIDPRGEITRLIQLNKERDYKEVSDKFKKIGRVINTVLLIPKYRSALIRAVTIVRVEGIQFDEADRWWANMKTDYNYFGKSYEERSGGH